MRAAVLAIGTLGGLAAGAGPVHADGLDLLNPREVAVGDAMRAGAVGSSARSNPAGLPLSNELVFEGGYGYSPEDSLSAISLSACDSTNAAPGCFYYSYLTASPELDGMSLSRSAHVVGTTLSRAFTPRLLLGVGVKYYRFTSTMPDESNNKGFTYDLGATIRATDSVNLGVVGYNLIGDRSDEFPRAFAVGAQLRPVPALTASFDAFWDLDHEGQDGRYGGGLEYFLTTSRGQTGYPLRAGAVYDNPTESTYITAGLGVATMRLGFDVGGRRQVKGGDEMMIVASLRFFGPRQPAPAR